jgi:hypothetical protein
MITVIDIKFSLMKHLFKPFSDCLSQPISRKSFSDRKREHHSNSYLITSKSHQSNHILPILFLHYERFSSLRLNTYYTGFSLRALETAPHLKTCILTPHIAMSYNVPSSPLTAAMPQFPLLCNRNRNSKPINPTTSYHHPQLSSSSARSDRLSENK